MRSNYGSPSECTSDVPIDEYKAYVVSINCEFEIYLYPTCLLTFTKPPFPQNDYCYNVSGSASSYNYPTKTTYANGD